MVDADCWIEADWPVSKTVHAGTTTRHGGVSKPPYDAFNLALHVDDDPDDVIANRNRLSRILALPRQPVWLNQTHSTRVVNLDNCTDRPDADASFTRKNGVVCAVLTADCLPILLSDNHGTQVAAIHAGWRGLLNGIIEQTVSVFHGKHLLAWLGPGISQQAFEVGEEVRDAFMQYSNQCKSAFIAGRQGQWYADLYLLAELRLNACGVSDLTGGGFCTYAERERFYSYRRCSQTGRMATLIWIE